MGRIPRILILFVSHLLIGCPFEPDGEWDNSLQLKNHSNDEIFVQVTSRTRPSEFDFCFGCEANGEVFLALPGTDRWKSMIAKENGIVLNIFADSHYHESQQD